MRTDMESLRGEEPVAVTAGDLADLQAPLEPKGIVKDVIAKGLLCLRLAQTAAQHLGFGTLGNGSRTLAY
jgi:hypothetical protein